MTLPVPKEKCPITLSLSLSLFLSLSLKFESAGWIWWLYHIRNCIFGDTLQTIVVLSYDFLSKKCKDIYNPFTTGYINIFNSHINT